jgi:hypothetical protein
MVKKPFGCLTIPGIVTALLTAMVVFIIGMVRGGVLFSPGQLNAQPGALLGGVTSHAALSGTCSSCHAYFWQKDTMADRCISCHRDIAADLQDPTTLHGAELQRDPHQTCRDCHPDHRGASASLIDLSKVNVSHDVFGYALTAHQRQANGSPFTCNSCHTNDFSGFDQTICTSCHAQINADFMPIHLQAFGGDCLACHDGIDSYGHNFDHNKVAFQLSGKHTQLDCSACHGGDRSIADLKSTPQDCFSCHARDDVHQGGLGSDCETCHSSAGWLPATFDHAKTSFPLTGAHLTLKCSQCHTTPSFGALSSDCFSCHAADDAHKGEFGTGCGTCHTTEAWLPATFDHSNTSFPLTGAHLDMQCIECHSTADFSALSGDCISCHAKDDAHNGEFGTGCDSCHTTDAWLPATFDHSKTNFPLTGAHVGLACSQCHASQVFTGINPACASCHSDPSFHAGLFVGMACDQCHNTSAWSQAAFNLTHPNSCGEVTCINHERATCRDCHPAELASATCLKCHDSNTPGDGEGGGGDD